MFKRFGLFFMVNILVVITISIVTSALGVNRYMTAQGIDYQALLIFCLIWGMVGSFISLMISKWMAKVSMGVKIVEANGPYAELISMVHRMARQAGLEKMPEVGVYESPDINAFATGPSRNNSLVAVSTGLLQRMDRQEIEGVVGHEVAHIANGDMVTMTLIQGIVNAFVMFFSRVVAFAISNAMRSSDDDNRGASPMIQFVLIMVFDALFSFLAMPVVAWFSRYREYRADHGGAQLAGRENMVAALEALQRNYGITEQVKPAQGMRSMQISSKAGWMELFSTHPPLPKRIAALNSGR